MEIIPLGIIWAGYTAVWFGMMMLRGNAGPGVTNGVTIKMLVLPSEVSQVEAIWQGDAAAAASGSFTAPTNSPNGGNQPYGFDQGTPTNPNTGQAGVDPNTGQPVYIA